MDSDLKYIKANEHAKIVGLHYRAIARKYHESKIESYKNGKAILLLNPLHIDLITIITSFCGRFHGANKKEKTTKVTIYDKYK